MRTYIMTCSELVGCILRILGTTNQDRNPATGEWEMYQWLTLCSEGDEQEESRRVGDTGQQWGLSLPASR
jgi:hypothetical protein